LARGAQVNIVGQQRCASAKIYSLQQSSCGCDRALSQEELLSEHGLLCLTRNVHTSQHYYALEVILQYAQTLTIAQQPAATFYRSLQQTHALSGGTAFGMYLHACRACIAWVTCEPCNWLRWSS
jgi:hypothetical protein